MAKDYKAGLIVGLVLVIATVVWLSMQPSLSVGSRLKEQNKRQEQKPDLTKIIRENANQNNSIEPSSEENTSHKEDEIPNNEGERANNIESGNNDLSKYIDLSSIQVDNEDIYHTVEKGDDVWGLAQKYYGDRNLVSKIEKANPYIDVYNLKPGIKLIIPPR